MEPFDQQNKQLFQEEADEALFHSFEFDNRIKEKVRQQLIAEARGRASPWMIKGHWKHWLVMGSIAVSLLGVVIMSGLLNPQSTDPFMMTEGVEDMEAYYSSEDLSMNPLITPSPETDQGDQLSILSEIVKESTIEKATHLFGEPLRWPSYIPDGYQLHHVQTIEQQGETKRVELLYASEDGYFQWIQSKDHVIHPQRAGKKVTIQGYEGFITQALQDDRIGQIEPLVELEWIADGIQYSLIGTLSEEELIKIGNSMVLND